VVLIIVLMNHPTVAQILPVGEPRRIDPGILVGQWCTKLLISLIRDDSPRLLPTRQFARSLIPFS